jgi:predicted nucleic acid-binding protein
MKKVFLDASVLVAACASKRGASAFIFGCCRREKLHGFISMDVIGESRKNVNLKLGENSKNRLKFYLKKAKLVLVDDPSMEMVFKCEEVINVKDAPILAAAIISGARYLITLDKKDFLKEEVFKFVKPMQILTPGEFISKFRKELS